MRKSYDGALNMFGFYDVPKFVVKIIQEHDEGEQVRKHKKRRINKKWLKRYRCYGTQKLKPGEVLVYDNVIYMSRAYFNKLKKELS